MGNTLKREKEHNTSLPQMCMHIKRHISANKVFSITVLNFPSIIAFPKTVSFHTWLSYFCLISLWKYIWKNYVVPVYAAFKSCLNCCEANKSTGLTVCVILSYCPCSQHILKYLNLWQSFWSYFLCAVLFDLKEC